MAPRLHACVAMTDEPSQPEISELDLPDEDDPVAWSYIQVGTPVVGRDGQRLGSVAGMLGTEAEGIFHGIALSAERGGPMRMIPADAVTDMTPRRVEVDLGPDGVGALAEYHPPRG